MNFLCKLLSYSLRLHIVLSTLDYILCNLIVGTNIGICNIYNAHTC